MKVTESLLLKKCSFRLLHKAVAQINELIFKRQLWFPCNNSAIKVQSLLMTELCCYCFCYRFYWYQGLMVTVSTSFLAALKCTFIIIIFELPYFFVSTWGSFPSLFSAALEKQLDVFRMCHYWPHTLLFTYSALFS